MATNRIFHEHSVCLVVGGSRGIGRAAAHAIAAAGAHVALTARSLDQAEAVAADIVACGGQAIGLQADVTDLESLQRTVLDVERRVGPLNLAFHNAGDLLGVSPLSEIPVAQFRRTMEVNLHGVFHGLRAILPAMQRAGRGSLVVNAASAGLRGRPMIADYVASKWGAIGLCLSAAIENGPLGIRVNAVAPGFIGTDSWLGSMGSQSAELARRVPLRRIGAPEDVADTVVWLLSDAARYLTGTVITVDGGLLAS